MKRFDSNNGNFYMDYGIKSKQFFANENSSSMSEMNAKSEFEKNIQSYSQDTTSPLTTAAAMAAAQIISHISQQSNSPAQAQSVSSNFNIDPTGHNSLAFQVVTAAAAAISNQGSSISNSKHIPVSPKIICAICGDKASGKHYGVHSCEGCKGFFKRTVRKDLTYSCRDKGHCIVDKRQRNRCQYCRYRKCLTNGMKREAVQEERHKYKYKNEQERDKPSPTSDSCDFREELKDFQIADELNDDLILTVEEREFLKKITLAEDLYNPEINNPDSNPCSMDALYESLEKQLNKIPQWAKSIDKFQELEIDDQVNLLRANWREILCCSVSHRSVPVNGTLVLANGCIFSTDCCSDENLKFMIERLIMDIINVMKDLELDRVELSLLKLILLFDSDVKNLKESVKINDVRDFICLTLSKYCRRDQFVSDPSRFAKLLLRLPSMRSWVLKGSEIIMSIKASNSFDNILVETFVKNQKKF